MDIFSNPPVIIIIVGFVLDLLLGDPYCLPHPIRLFGQMIAWMEDRLNKGKHLKLKGVFMWFCLTIFVFLLFYVIEKILSPYPIALCVFGSIFFFYGISNRSLIEEVLKVDKSLCKKDLKLTRNQLSMIVGRDTQALSASQIRCALLETLSENLSDGVITPIFFYAIGGIPLMMVYKMINTLDSMVGYKNDRFRAFGFWSAKMDDIANFIPSRLTAVFMALVSFSPRAVLFIFRYGSNHSSPNSGYPEASLAGILNCQFGGPNYYKGILVDKPYIGIQKRDMSHRDVIKACIVNMLVTIFTLAILIVGILFICRFTS